ncbi:MAG TPA: 16S rRNA (uracil(1498)-N(3))-methyltransferase [Pirellulales bacterium]|nr:16S rRNA (uracil(1498)-N(3))-methyltransferase [Pirellulales bacterium]
MSERFFVATPIVADRATLDGAEAHHLARVMRAQVGDSVTLFDGSGFEFMAQIESMAKSRIEFVVLQRREVNRESPVPLTLAVALPKGDRQRWLVEKAVELGVAALVPLETQRGVAQPSAAALNRLRRTVIEASKQCGRNRLLEIAAPQPWRTYVAANQDVLRMVAHSGGNPLCSVWPSQLVEAGNLSVPCVTAAIGPEGGFTKEEIDQALAAGWKAVDLGPRVLRVETAAIALAAWAALMGAAICR